MHRTQPLTFLARLALLLGLLSAQPTQADFFGSGENRFEIPFVKIGDPGNAPDMVVPNPVTDPLPTGVVNYEYRIAKYEISEEIISKVNSLSDAAGDPISLTVDQERGPNKPATGLSWFDAARFANWLNEDAGCDPAYKFDASGNFQLWQPGDPGYNANNPFRNSRAHYFLPSADEWHKAAYYDAANDRYWLYPHGADTPPVAVESGTDPGTAVYNQSGPADVELAGGENVNGVVGLAGNVYDFEETAINLINDDVTARRGANGGSWSFDLTTSLSSSFRNSGLPGTRQPTGGIRIASVPEPSATILLLTSICTSLLALRRDRLRNLYSL